MARRSTWGQDGSHARASWSSSWTAARSTWGSGGRGAHFLAEWDAPSHRPLGERDVHLPALLPHAQEDLPLLLLQQRPESKLGGPGEARAGTASLDPADEHLLVLSQVGERERGGVEELARPVTEPEEELAPFAHVQGGDP